MTADLRSALRAACALGPECGHPLPMSEDYGSGKCRRQAGHDPKHTATPRHSRWPDKPDVDAIIAIVSGLDAHPPSGPAVSLEVPGDAATRISKAVHHAVVEWEDHGGQIEPVLIGAITAALAHPDAPAQTDCRHGSTESECASCAACDACDGECGICPYVDVTPPQSSEQEVVALRAEVGRLTQEIERFRPLWASPLAPPKRWVSEPIPYPRRYVSTFEVLKTYDESIRCSSDWPAESRHAAMDKALHSIPDLAYEIDYLRQDLDEARTRLADVTAAFTSDAAVDALARSKYERFDSHYSMPGGLSWAEYVADDPDGAQMYLCDAADDVDALTAAASVTGQPDSAAGVRCSRCGGLNGTHGLVHVRHGNGGGHNEPCPFTPGRGVES